MCLLACRRGNTASFKQLCVSTSTEPQKTPCSIASHELPSAPSSKDSVRRRALRRAPPTAQPKRILLTEIPFCDRFFCRSNPQTRLKSSGRPTTWSQMVRIAIRFQAFSNSKTKILRLISVLWPIYFLSEDGSVQARRLLEVVGRYVRE
jgi:hypothetical protein